MTGLLLRLAGPLQAWGEHGTFTEKDTADFPTRSGLLGLLAAAGGIPRDRDLGEVRHLDFTVRIDRPGVRIVDFHTAGGKYPYGRGIPTADGKRKHTAIVTRRHYLSDAVFTVACTGPAAIVKSSAAAVRRPRWQPFLGRRSCPPEQPLLLGVVEDAEAALHEVPLHRRPPRGHKSVTVDFVRTAEPDTTATAWSQIFDDPDRFSLADRRFRPRTIVRTTEHIDAALCQSDPESHREALIDFMREVSGNDLADPARTQHP